MLSIKLKKRTGLRGKADRAGDARTLARRGYRVAGVGVRGNGARAAFMITSGSLGIVGGQQIRSDDPGMPDELDGGGQIETAPFGDQLPKLSRFGVR